MDTMTRALALASRMRGYADGGSPDESALPFTERLVRRGLNPTVVAEGDRVSKELKMPRPTETASDVPLGVAADVGRWYRAARNAQYEREAAEHLAKAGRDRPLHQPSGNRAFDKMRDELLEKNPELRGTLESASRNAGGMKDLERDFMATLNPIDWVIMKTGGPGSWGSALGHAATQVGLNSALHEIQKRLGFSDTDTKDVAKSSAAGAAGGLGLSAALGGWGRLGLPAAGAGLGHMKALWDDMNAKEPPGTQEIMPGVRGKMLTYPGGFPRLERTESQLRDRYESSRTGGYKDNRYGILGGGILPYDEWKTIQEDYGGTLHYPPQLNAPWQRHESNSYPIAPNWKGYGPGPYKAIAD